MFPSKQASRAGASALALLSVAALSSCGGNSATYKRPVAAAATPTAVQQQAFPRPGGKTLRELVGSTPQGPIMAPSVSIITPGQTNRVAFALFDRARKQVTGANVGVYTASADGTGVRGPFMARSESLAVKPQFQSQTAAKDPDAAHSVYVADVPFPKAGDYIVTSMARFDGRLVAASAFQFRVLGPKRAGAQPPGVGDRAVRIHTPTITSASGDVTKIDTRSPPARDLHEVDFADVLGRKPVVLVFATPALCQSRVCGPVVDVVEQVKAQTGDKAAFVHMEIYNDNQVAKGYRPQLAAWRLSTEPWTFVIDRTGIVRTRFEGAVSVDELQRAVDQVVR